MYHKILKPEITDIRKNVWGIVMAHWQFWLIGAIIYTLVMGVLTNWKAAVPILLFTIFFVLLYLAIIILPKIETSFWMQIAEINGWQYKGKSDISKESGVMFRRVDTNGKNISNEIEGDIDGRNFRVFSYQFVEGSDKNRTIYHYTIFSFKFNGSFPQIYLHNKRDSFNYITGEKISLPAEFEKEFSLSAPKEYEIEALDIFTPDVLIYLLNEKFISDIEFVNQEMFIFFGGRINNVEEFEDGFNRALGIEDLLDEKLDKFKFKQIGDMPYILK